MRQWAHSPSRAVFDAGVYIVTSGTYNRERLFAGSKRLEFLHDSLLELSDELNWHLEAWAVFENHYHFVGHSPHGENCMSELAKRIHGGTATELNRLDGTPGRRVWMGYWQTKLTYPRSYMARLNYVMNNPVKHGLAAEARDYPWCSASWFEANSASAWRRTIQSFGTERVSVPDDF